MLNWTDAERKRLAAKLSSHVPDNGLVHWGMGMHGSLCGVVEKTRKEECINKARVKCPTCIRILRSRP